MTQNPQARGRGRGGRGYGPPGTPPMPLGAEVQQPHGPPARGYQQPRQQQQMQQQQQLPLPQQQMMMQMPMPMQIPLHAQQGFQGQPPMPQQLMQHNIPPPQGYQQPQHFSQGPPQAHGHGQPRSHSRGGRGGSGRGRGFQNPNHNHQQPPQPQHQLQPRQMIAPPQPYFGVPPQMMGSMPPPPQMMMMMPPQGMGAGPQLMMPQQGVRIGPGPARPMPQPGHQGQFQGQGPQLTAAPQYLQGPQSNFGNNAGGAHFGTETPPQTPTSPEQAPTDEAMRPPLAKFDQSMMDEFSTQYSDMVDSVPVQPPSLDYERCMKCIAENDITFVITDTGSGKSSILPKHMLETYKKSKIIVSQTRRTAAVGLATRVAELRGEEVGNEVGYLVRGEHKGSFEKSRLMYVTTYLLFLHVINNPGDLKADYIVLDEFHERTADIEVTLALLRIALRQGQKFKIVILSATLSSDLWKDFFAGLKIGEFCESYNQFPVNVWHMEEISKLVSLAPFELKEQEIDQVARTSVQNLYLFAREMIAFLAAKGATEHAILLFLPGRNEINKIRMWVETYFPDTLDPIEWFADVDLDKIKEEINRKPTNNRKKVYLATDIAEVSVTIPDAVFVIDCCLTKKPRVIEKKPNTVSFPPLETIPVSHSSIRQRKGRVGRVQAGFYFCLLTRQFLPSLQQPQSQIVNTVLDTLTLHVLQVCENPKAVFAQASTQPRDASLRLSLLKLLDCGAIVKATQQNAIVERRQLTSTARWKPEFEGEAGTVEDTFYTTAKGQMMQFIPLRIACADLVYWGAITGIPEVALVAACVAEAGSPFYSNSTTTRPSMEDLKRTRDSMRKYSPECPSDIIASVALVADFKRIAETTSEAAKLEWCQSRQASLTRLEQILLYERSITDSLVEKIPGLVVNPNADTLTIQLRQYGPTLNLLIGIAFAINSIWVVNDAANAQRVGFVGNSIFMHIKALADQSSASLSSWPRKRIVVPTSLRSFGKLLGHTVVEFERPVFNMLSLCTSSNIVYATETTPNGREEVVCRFSRQGRNKYCRVEPSLFQGVLMFRDAICAQMDTLFLNVGDVPDVEEIQARYAGRGGDLLNLVRSHTALPVFITKILDKLVHSTGSMDVERPEVFNPTHRSLLLASNKTSVTPFVQTDEVAIEVTIREAEELDD